MIRALLDGAQSLLDRVVTKQYEKPCGCTHRVVRTPRNAAQAPQIEELDHELVTKYTEDYTNATVYHQEWRRHLQCLECNAMFTIREPAGRKTAYGEPNPDADAKLRVREPLPRQFVHEAEPVVRTESAAEEYQQ